MALTNKLAVITGGSSGLGKSITKLFANNGSDVALVDINPNIAQIGHDILKNKNFKFSTHVCDVSNSSQVNALFNEIKSIHLRVPNVIINSAGITRDSFLLKMSEKDYDAVIDVNLKGTFLITQAAIRHLMENIKTANIDSLKTYASIINISSIVGKFGNIGQTNYAASKAGVIGFTLSTAKEMGKFKIRCNSILPGFIKTPMTEKLPIKSVEVVKRMIPLGAFGEPEDVAHLALFLASDSSSYITGANIECSGGLSF